VAGSAGTEPSDPKRGSAAPHRPEQILPIRGGLHRGGVRGVVRTLVIWAGAGAGAVI